MEEELKRLEDLDSLAGQIIADCDGVESGLKQLEDKLSDFEQNSASMTTGEAGSLTEQIQSEIKALEDVLDKQVPRVQQLKDCSYHKAEEIEKR